MDTRPHRPERDLECRRDLLVRQVCPREEQQRLPVTGIETHQSLDEASPGQLIFRYTVRGALSLRLAQTRERRVGSDPAFLGPAVVTEHVRRNTEQPSSCVPLRVQVSKASQRLRERLGRNVERGIASHTTRREAVNRTEVGDEQPLYRLPTSGARGHHYVLSRRQPVSSPSSSVGSGRASAGLDPVSAQVKAHGLEPDPRLAETEQAVRAALGGELDDLWATGGTLDLAAAVELALVSLD